YQSGQANFTDSSSGSISTSPSSAASSLTYTAGYPQAQYSTIPQTFASFPHAFIGTSYVGARMPPMTDQSASSMLPPPRSSAVDNSTVSQSPGAAIRSDYATPTQHLSRHQLSPLQTPFASYSEAPRSALSAATLPVSQSSAQLYSHHMASPNASTYAAQQNESLAFPFNDPEHFLEIYCDGQPVVPRIEAKIEKGFFVSPERVWTCYRRNYFSVVCSYLLTPHIGHGRLYIKRGSKGSQELIQALGMRLSAAVDGANGKGIELVQHTAKRDKGPQMKIRVEKVSPTPPNGRANLDHAASAHGYNMPLTSFHPTGAPPMPYLPLQNTSDGSEQSSTPSASSSQPGPSQVPSQGYPYTGHGALSGGPSTQYTFERIQFKSATANNGKRRATQQFFHLIVELFADVRRDGDPEPNWVKVTQRISDKIVVRGRSPSHYSNEG
ncbi:hypothetical protein LTR66_014608, partial [Elasticomyces elasticus]